MKKDNFFDRVIRVICEEIGFPEDEIVPETNLKQDLKANNDDLVFIVMGLEDEFGIDFPDEVMKKCSTVSDIVEYIEKKKKGKGKRNDSGRKSAPAHH